MTVPVSLSPVFTGQQFDNAGNMLANGMLYAYVAPSFSVLQTTYSDSAGAVPNANPIILSSTGRLPSGLYLDNTKTYNFVLTASDGTTVIQQATNILPIALANFTGQKTISYATAGQAVFNLPFTYQAGSNVLNVYLNGAKLVVGVDYTETSASSFTLAKAATFNDVVEVDATAIITFASSSVNTQKQNFTAVAGQTLFNLSFTYTNGLNTLNVYMNGSKLLGGTDYIETSASSFTLTVAASAGDLFEVTTTGLSSLNTANSTSVSYLPSGTGAVTTTVSAKLQESVSVKDFGAKGDGVTDDTAAIQAAITYVNTAGGGTVHVPATSTYYKISTALTLYANIRIIGEGYSSRIHSVNTTRLSALYAAGTSGTHIAGIEIRSLRITAATTFSGGAPSVLTGNGINLNFVDNGIVEGCYVSNWSDSGMSFTDGSNNKALNNNVDATAQGIQIFASAANTYSNEVIGNTVTNTGEYDGIAIEGATNSGTGLNFGVKVIGNSVVTSYNQGINIENSPYTTVTGNTVTASGGGAGTWGGVHLFGSYNCTINSNTSYNNTGYGVILGANCGYTAVSGNSTIGNSVTGCLVTDNGTASTYNVAMGINAWQEGDIATSGNVSFLNRIESLKFSNVAVADATTLDWYQEGTFTPTIQGSAGAGPVTYVAQTGNYTRIGNRCYFDLQIAWSAISTYSGALTILGLPFTAITGGEARPLSIYVVSGVAPGAGNILQAYVVNNTTTIYVGAYVASSGASASQAISSAGNFILSGHYQI